MLNFLHQVYFSGVKERVKMENFQLGSLGYRAHGAIMVEADNAVGELVANKELGIEALFWRISVGVIWQDATFSHVK